MKTNAKIELLIDDNNYTNKVVLNAAKSPDPDNHPGLYVWQDPMSGTGSLSNKLTISEASYVISLNNPQWEEEDPGLWSSFDAQSVGTAPQQNNEILQCLIVAMTADSYFVEDVTFDVENASGKRYGDTSKDIVSVVDGGLNGITVYTRDTNVKMMSVVIYSVGV
jgi:hypothetical protein